MHRQTSLCARHAIKDLSTLLRKAFADARPSTHHREAILSAPTVRRWQRARALTAQHVTAACIDTRHYVTLPSADLLVDESHETSEPQTAISNTQSETDTKTDIDKRGPGAHSQDDSNITDKTAGGTASTIVSGPQEGTEVTSDTLCPGITPPPGQSSTQLDMRKRHQWEKEQISQSFATFTELVFNGQSRPAGATISEENDLRSSWRKDMRREIASHVLNLEKSRVDEPTSIKDEAEGDQGFRLHIPKPLVDIHNDQPQRTGVCAVMPELPHHQSYQHDLPWQVSRSERQTMSGIALLSSEIERAAAFLLPTEEELKARDKVATSLYHHVSSLLSKHEVRMVMHGSARTGLAAALADLDFTILDRTEKTSRATQAALHDLRRQVFASDTARGDTAAKDFLLTSSHWVKGHPLIQLHHQLTDIDVQVIAGSSTISQGRWTQDVLRKYPFVKPIFMVMRAALQMRGLHDTHTGGINSWVLLNMIMACVRRQDYVRTLPTLGDQLLFILRYLGEFPIERFGLCARTGKILPKRIQAYSANKPHSEETKMLAAALYRHEEKGKLGFFNFQRFQDSKPWLMALQDATKHDRILGPTAQAIEYIQDTFRFLNIKLAIGVREFDEAQARGNVWEHDSIMEPLLGRVHEIQHERRRQLSTGYAQMKSSIKDRRATGYTLKRIVHGPAKSGFSLSKVYDGNRARGPR